MLWKGRYMKILIVDDSKQSTYFMKSMLDNRPDLNVVVTITSAANAEMICLGQKIDLILMDVCTADNADGIKVAKKIKTEYPSTKIIIVTSMPEYSFIREAKAAGCEGFWYKEFGDVNLVDVIDRVGQGEMVYPEETPVLQIGQAKSTDFNDREYLIIKMLADGIDRQEIADKLGISIRTVRYYIDEMKAKTGYDDTLKMVSDFVQQKLIINNLK